MVFSSITFLFYFLPIAIIGYYVFSFSRVVQNMWLLLVSLVFYAWGEPVFVFVMIGSILMNWLFGMLLGKVENDSKKRKIILIVACCANLGLLGIFKYTNFIVDIIYSISGIEVLLKVPQIALPIGISFFTFQAMSYVIDVYRHDAKVQKNPFYLGLYVAFFPQLVAGPIVRYNSIEEQIQNRKTTFPMFSDGCCRFAVGLVKKILISNNMAVIADQIFSLATAGSDVKVVPMMLAWLGAIAYTFQLYYDFSSYSDMAIGLGKMFGFTFEENFNYPFISKSVREFMARWHISLGTWFNQYVYRPLGGSRVENQDIMVRNLFIVWLLTGVWHGAAWTFIWWGLYFFVLILIEKVLMFEKWEGHAVLKHIYTLVAVVFAMVIFRSNDMRHFSQMALNMLALNGNGFFSETAVMILKEYWTVFAAGIICLMPVKDYFKKWLGDRQIPAAVQTIGGTVYVVGLLSLLFFCVVVLAKGGYNPFIYFNF